MNAIDLQVSIGKKALIEKYGEEFVEAVICSEVQLFVDSLSDKVFKNYSKMEDYKGYIQP